MPTIATNRTIQHISKATITLQNLPLITHGSGRIDRTTAKLRLLIVVLLSSSSRLVLSPTSTDLQSRHHRLSASSCGAAPFSREATMVRARHPRLHLLHWSPSRQRTSRPLTNRSPDGRQARWQAAAFTASHGRCNLDQGSDVPPRLHPSPSAEGSARHPCTLRAPIPGWSRHSHDHHLRAARRRWPLQRSTWEGTLGTDADVTENSNGGRGFCSPGRKIHPRFWSQLTLPSFHSDVPIK
jgi:hypothetical protein